MSFRLLVALMHTVEDREDENHQTDPADYDHIPERTTGAFRRKGGPHSPGILSDERGDWSAVIYRYLLQGKESARERT